MKVTRTILDDILVDVRKELASAQEQRPETELQRMIADAPPVRSFIEALTRRFGLIAEWKKCSPSQGPMRAENYADAPRAYANSDVVVALSVLTNGSHFGMNMERLREMRQTAGKPVLRKDFIFDDYQVYEARAFGADAILLMANLLDAPEMLRLYRLTRELGMEALFECHDREQIGQVPPGATIYGINSRTFAVGSGTYTEARAQREAGGTKDLTTNLDRFELGQFLPAHALKVAESGVHPHTVAKLRDQLGYHAALVGTSLLTASHGIVRELEQFEGALAGSGPATPP